MRNPHADHDGESLPDVVAGGDEILVEPGLLAVGVEGAGEGRPESGDVGPPLGRRDVVDVTVEVLGEFAGVLQGDVEGDPLLLADDRDHVGMDGIARAVEPLDILDDAPLVAILLGLTTGGVGEDDPQAAVEEGQFLEATGEDVEGELRRRKDLRVGFERRLRAGARGGADIADRSGDQAALVLLLPDMAVAVDLHLAPLGEEVDHRHAHAMEAAGGLVGALLELAAELEDRHHPLERGDVAIHLLRELRVPLDRDATAVVLDGHAAVHIDRDAHPLRMARHAFVDRVVDDLVDEMVETTGGVVADVHAEPFADMLPVGEVEKILGGVSGLAGFVSHATGSSGWSGGV